MTNPRAGETDLAGAEIPDAGPAQSGDTPSGRRRTRHSEGFTDAELVAETSDPERFLRDARRRRREAAQNLPAAQVRWIEGLTGANVSAAGPGDDAMDLDVPAGQDEPMDLDQALDAWTAAEGQGEGEDRAEAVRRIREWVQAGNVESELDLSELNLTRLPARLPRGLLSLSVTENQLTSLQGVPEGLFNLDITENQLTSLQGVPEGLSNLDISENQLTSLEGLPPGLESLSVSYNPLPLRSLEGLPQGLEELQISGLGLTSLRGFLPEGLTTLAAHDNELTSFDGIPAGLQEFLASKNLFTSLEGVPPGLTSLDLRENELTSLQGLPEGLRLRRLDAEDNQLTSLPEDLLTRMRADGVIHLEGNPLSERVRTNLAAVLNAPGYAGPHVHFSMEGGQEQAAARPLGEATADWLGEDDAEAAAWEGFAEEEGAAEYARFLDRLQGTVSYGNHEFRQAVVKDLSRAAERPRLREKYFLLAFGATETCEDRVTLTWNGMQTARLTDDVETGAYDDRLDELVPAARRLFRLDALDRIAREKVQSLRFIDEIEVYLAYQVKLRERLDLRLVAPDMRYFGVSHVTEADLDAAEVRVRQEEAAEFAAYLATKWQPWEKVVSRLAPEAYEAMQERLIEAMGDEFQERLARRLADEGLTGVADAERELGAQVRDELAREIKGELMRQVLRDKGLESLLASPAA